eukprot:2978061-Rhodomonas_salina.1
MKQQKKTRTRNLRSSRRAVTTPAAEMATSCESGRPSRLSSCPRSRVSWSRVSWSRVRWSRVR